MDIFIIHKKCPMEVYCTIIGTKQPCISCSVENHKDHVLCGSGAYGFLVMLHRTIGQFTLLLHGISLQGFIQDFSPGRRAHNGL